MPESGLTRDDAITVHPVTLQATVKSLVVSSFSEGGRDTWGTLFIVLHSSGQLGTDVRCSGLGWEEKGYYRKFAW